MSHKRTAADYIAYGLVTLILVAAVVAVGLLLAVKTPLDFVPAVAIVGLVALVSIAAVNIKRYQSAHPKPVKAPEPVRRAQTLPAHETTEGQTSAAPYAPKITDTQAIPVVQPEAVPEQASDTPDEYDHRLHVIGVIPALMANAFITVVLITGVVLLIMHNVIDGRYFLLIVVIIGISAYLMFRRYWIWAHHPIRCSPKDGRLRVVQTRNMKYLIRGSSDDIYPLGAGDTVIDSPKQTWTESFLFKKSQTLILRDAKGERQIKLRVRHVVNIDHLIAIDAYRRELETISVEYQRESLRLQRETLEELRRLGRSQ